VANILKATEAQYNSFYALTSRNSGIAIEQTKDWLLTQPNVASAESLDSNYIDITLSSGLETMFYIDELTPDGHSKYRGGGGSQGVRLEVTGTPSTHTIKNKNVLIYAPGYSEFYTPAQMQRIVNMLNASGKVSVTLQVDDKCGYKMLESFQDYGWVIMDTHGEPDAFWTGIVVDTAAGNDETLLKANIIAAAGTDGYDRIQAKELRLVATSKKKAVVINGEPASVDYASYQLWATTKYIATLPTMPSTIVYGNMCYSGFAAPLQNGKIPMRTAWLSKQPISYYGYTYDNDRSTFVTDTFSKQMEDSIVRAFVIDGDSTGAAYKAYDGTIYFDEVLLQHKMTNKELRFKHYGADDYSYSNCTDVFTDNRDGIIYKAVCIGKQTWMAENLRYNASGSKCYDDKASNCDTYGKLYDWPTVMNGAASSDASPSGIKGICPKGWHLPSRAEWVTLVDFLGGEANAGRSLKSTLGWSGTGNGSNSSGFSGLASGYWNGLGLFYEKIDTAGVFWSSTEYQADPAVQALFFFLSSTDNRALVIPYVKSDENSCRCLKD
jgi:uncharacterized protein (TIGR02145 family)